MLVTSDEQWSDLLAGSTKPLLLYVSAAWCIPCRTLGPIMETVDAEHNEFTVVKVDADTNPNILELYNVLSIPTVLIFVNGKVMSTKVGGGTKFQVESWINEVLE